MMGKPLVQNIRLQSKSFAQVVEGEVARGDAVLAGQNLPEQGLARHSSAEIAGPVEAPPNTRPARSGGRDRGAEAG